MAGLIRQVLGKLTNRNVFTYVTNKVTSPICSANARFYANTPTPYEIVDSAENNKVTHKVVQQVNDLVAAQQQGRLFAVVHVAGKQFKITAGDVIVVEGYWPPDVGDKISLDKVLLAGGADFTLIGRPLVQQGLVNIHATIIEKSLSHTKTHFRKKRRKQYKRINFCRVQQTMVRINKVEINGKVNEPLNVTGLEHAIF